MFLIGGSSLLFRQKESKTQQGPEVGPRIVAWTPFAFPTQATQPRYPHSVGHSAIQTNSSNTYRTDKPGRLAGRLNCFPGFFGIAPGASSLLPPLLSYRLMVSQDSPSRLARSQRAPKWLPKVPHMGSQSVTYYTKISAETEEILIIARPTASPSSQRLASPASTSGRPLLAALVCTVLSCVPYFVW